MVNRNFNVLRGGLDTGLENKQKHFISAYVTDTRLMGVLAVYASWSIRDASGAADPAGNLHQFFYIDCEEAGLETYKGLRGDFGPEALSVEQSLVGGLGAEKIKLTERELKGILCYWKAFNNNRGLPLPEGIEDCSFLFTPEVIFSDREYFEVMNHICPDITRDYQLVNYFLMRCFGRDYEAAYLLTEACSEGHDECVFPLNLYDNYEKATFCRNVIDVEKRYGDGSVSYLCESLVEMSGEYDSVISKVVVRNLRVIGFEHCSRFRVSSTEAAMMLSKSEYITLYDVLLTEDEIEDNIGEFTIGFNAIMSRHDKGRMFMSFKTTNAHVNERIFMLSNDVRGVFFLTDSRQLVVSAYNARDIFALEKMVKTSPLGPYLAENERYTFIEPVLLEFVNSGMDYFDEFVDLITE